MIYLVSDTHFYHKNIIEYCHRPFKHIGEMNQTLISNWNSVVCPDDEVFHLGDFTMAHFVEGKWESYKQAYIRTCRELLAQLNGHKILVMGNHDRYLSPQQWRDLGFEECYDLPVILRKFFILSHAPLYVCRSMPYANLYGHVHNSPTYNSVSSRSACVSVERIDYTPILLETLRDQMLEKEKLEKNS